MSQKQSLVRDTPLRTPLPSRPYLRVFNAQHTPFSKSAAKMAGDMLDEADEQQGGTLYGTSINIRRAMAAVQRFVVNFSQGEDTIYRSQLIQMQDTEQCVFGVDGRHIYADNRQLYMQFIYYPVEMISCFDQVLKDLYENYFIANEPDQLTRASRQERKHKLMLGLKHLHEQDLTLIKELNPTKIGKLVALRGIVIRASEIYPQMKTAYFTCSFCGHSVEVELENARVAEPRNCVSCKQRECMEIQHNLCAFTDKQYIKFQELPEFVTEGETPGSVTVLAYDNNVDGFRPGDRVEVIGIYRAASSLVQRSKNHVRTIFNTYIDMISFSILEEKHHKIMANNTPFSDNQKKIFRKMAESPTIWQDLANSFAPSIFGHISIKKGLLTQLFGGTRKKFQEVGRNRFRSDINICLLGDPSTAKSQLLQQVHKISSRSIYTSGRGSSAVGLTANVRKDPQTREFVLESGALVLSDLGICCIDEFDKMDENSRTILLEAMQQQTISIAKAGIVCQLNSRTAILAAANPLHSKFDASKSVVQNINLPPALLSRFDLLYIILDVPNEENDRRLASHILNIYSVTASKQPAAPAQGVFQASILARYITYAREYIHPSLSEAAGKKLAQTYQDMRANGMSRKTITATPRQLESLIRLSEAFAKMRQSQVVEIPDVEQAIALMTDATLKTATDPETGLVNMDIITTGRSAALRKREEDIANRVQALILANKSTYRNATSIQSLEQHLKQVAKDKKEDEKTKIDRSELLGALKLLETQDLIVLFGEDKKKPYFKYRRDDD